MNELPADAAAVALARAVAGDAMTYPIELSELFDVDVDELARPVALIAPRWLSRFQGAQSIEAQALEDAADGGRLQRIDHECRGILAPGDDVDLFALQFLHDGLHAAALHADAGADRVDRAVIADDADLGAAARIARRRLDGDDAVVDFRHFLREQLRHELRMGARQEDLRTAVLAFHLEDDGAHPLGLQPVDHIGGDAGVEAERDAGDRNRDALGIDDADTVGERGAGHLAGRNLG